MTRNIRSAVLLSLATLTLSQHAFGATCSRADIDHYLDRGFSPEQVVELCGNAPVETTAQPTTAAPVQQAPAAPAPAPAPAPATTTAPAQTAVTATGLTAEETFKIKHSIDADQVDISDSELVYVRNRCHKFGEEDGLENRESACVITETRIQRSNLKVISAVEGLFLMRDPELLVTSDSIQRKVINPEAVKNKAKRKIFMDEFQAAPSELNIPLKKGFTPPQIAPALEKLSIR